jgi:hypothetical protein
MVVYLFRKSAWNPCSPKWSLVGEVFGTSGGVVAIPEYKIWPRWEPSPYATIVLTYGHEFAGCFGAGFEIRCYLFTPPFVCLGGCGGGRKDGKIFLSNNNGFQSSMDLDFFSDEDAKALSSIVFAL